jgi:CRP/FNR family transcriptional regulator, cyclic AMP receptor protein
VPDDVFSPRRLLVHEPIFMTDGNSLLRIAQALCGQLRAVDKQIAETIALNKSRTNGKHNSRVAPAPETRRAASRVNASALHVLPALRRFDVTELRALARLLRAIELEAGTLLFREGMKGGSCYLILDGTVAVTTRVGNEQHVLAERGPGEFVGEVSVIDGGVRSATCTITRDAVLAELRSADVKKLLASPVGLKLLGLLNEGIITALRDADRQLLQGAGALT